MLKKVIAGWNAAPGAPENWEPERDGDCGSLPIRVTKTRGGGVLWCESAWEPTPRELEQLTAGGQVILRVCGWQVPVALYVEPLSDATAFQNPDSIPLPGSRWAHRNGGYYTVLFLVNEPDDERYPLTIVYQGINGKRWARRADDWHRSMTYVGPAA